MKAKVKKTGKKKVKPAFESSAEKVMSPAKTPKAEKPKKSKNKSRESQDFLSVLEASRGQQDDVEITGDDPELQLGQDDLGEETEPPVPSKKKPNKKGKKVHVDDEDAGQEDEDGNYNPFISSIAALEGAPRSGTL